MSHPRSDNSGGRALDGRTVLVPRSLDRAVGLAARLHELGAQVRMSAVIERAQADDTDALDAAVRDLAAGRFAWTLVTSVNAIDELDAAWRRVAHPSTERTPKDDSNDTGARRDPGLADAPTRWAAVGPATARGLRVVGVEPALVPSESSALGLLAALRSVAIEPHDSPHDGPDVLLPMGDLARPTLANGLTVMGAHPHVVTAYRTVTHAIDTEVVTAWRAGEVDAVVLTSGSVAREIADQLGPRDDVAGVAIGAPTHRAATEVGLRIDAVADTPDDAGLAAAVVRALSVSPSELSEREGAIDHPRSDTHHELSEPEWPIAHPRSDTTEESQESP